MLLEAARAAEGFGNGARSVEYMRSFLRLFPQSPLAAEVRRKIRAQGA
jgi:hypothetical protein